MLLKGGGLQSYRAEQERQVFGSSNWSHVGKGRQYLCHESKVFEPWPEVVLHKKATFS